MGKVQYSDFHFVTQALPAGGCSDDIADAAMASHASKPKEIVVAGSRVPTRASEGLPEGLAGWATEAVHRAGARLIDCEGYTSLTRN